MAKKVGMSREFKDVRDAGKKGSSGAKKALIALSAALALALLAVGAYQLVTYLTSGKNGAIRTNPLTGELEAGDGWLLHRSGSGEYYRVGEARAAVGFQRTEVSYMNGKKPIYKFEPEDPGAEGVANYFVQVVSGDFDSAVKNGYDAMAKIAKTEMGEMSVSDIGGREVTCFYSVAPFAGADGQADHYTAYEDVYFRTGRSDCCVNVQISAVAKDRNELPGERALFNWVDNIVQRITID